MNGQKRRDSRKKRGAQRQPLSRGPNPSGGGPRAAIAAWRERGLQDARNGDDRRERHLQTGAGGGGAIQQPRPSPRPQAPGGSGAGVIKRPAGQDRLYPITMVDKRQRRHRPDNDGKASRQPPANEHRASNPKRGRRAGGKRWRGAEQPARPPARRTRIHVAPALAGSPNGGRPPSTLIGKRPDPEGLPASTAIADKK